MTIRKRPWNGQVSSSIWLHANHYSNKENLVLFWNVVCNEGFGENRSIRMQNQFCSHDTDSPYHIVHYLKIDHYCAWIAFQLVLTKQKIHLVYLLQLNLICAISLTPRVFNGQKAQVSSILTTWVFPTTASQCVGWLK